MSERNIPFQSFIQTNPKYISLVEFKLSCSRFEYSYQKSLTNRAAVKLPIGLLAKLVERCAAIAEVMGSNPVRA